MKTLMLTMLVLALTTSPMLASDDDGANIRRARRISTALFTAGLAFMAIDAQTENRSATWAAGGTLSAAAISMGVEIRLKRKAEGNRRQSLRIGADGVRFNITW